ncbi:MAG: hypothetical protein KTR14_08385 [Vampirovibrio sp.]|nr:hypothetical protein [Vampirovibrio sp.]
MSKIPPHSSPSGVPVDSQPEKASPASPSALPPLAANDNKDQFQAGPTPEMLETRQPIRSFLRGIIAPVKAVLGFAVENPLLSMVYVGTAVALISSFPLLGALLAMGVFGYGAAQMGVGVKNALNGFKTGVNRQFNQGFEQIGSGLFDATLTGSTALKAVRATRQSLQLAKSIPGLSAAQRLNILLKQITHPGLLAPGQLPASWKDLAKTVQQSVNTAATNPSTAAALPQVDLSVRGVLQQLEQFSQGKIGVDKVAQFLTGSHLNPSQIMQLARQVKANPELAMLLRQEKVLSPLMRKMPGLTEMIQRFTGGDEKTAPVANQR